MTHLTPGVEPDITEAAKLHAAAEHLEAAATGRASIDDSILFAMVLCGSVLEHEAAR